MEFLLFETPKLGSTNIRMGQTDMSDVTVSFMQKDELQESATALSIAMLKNPLHMAIFRGDSESERIQIEQTFTSLFSELPEIVYVAKKNGKIIGVMRMKSCQGRKDLKEPEGPKDLDRLSWRKHFWHQEWARHEPSNQHWHLGPIGVLPAYQGQGIGSQLMKRFCREVDTCQASAYLETDLDRNVVFYEKFGFRIVNTSLIFDVANRYMLRDPIS